MAKIYTKCDSRLQSADHDTYAENNEMINLSWLKIVHLHVHDNYYRHELKFAVRVNYDTTVWDMGHTRQNPEPL